MRHGESKRPLLSLRLSHMLSRSGSFLLPLPCSLGLCLLFFPPLFPSICLLSRWRRSVSIFPPTLSLSAVCSSLPLPLSLAPSLICLLSPSSTLTFMLFPSSQSYREAGGRAGSAGGLTLSSPSRRFSSPSQPLAGVQGVPAVWGCWAPLWGCGIGPSRG